MNKPSLNFITNGLGALFGGGLALDALLTPENVATIMQIAAASGGWQQLAIATGIWLALYAVGKKDKAPADKPSPAPTGEVAP
jgi:hypothetical protein